MSNFDLERRLDQAIRQEFDRAIRRRLDRGIRQEIGERLRAMLSRDAVNIPPRLRELVGRLDGDQDLGREASSSNAPAVPPRNDRPSGPRR